ncbi:tripartite tricarboxylate transporter substrate binding protein [Aeromonas caviae]|uniref:tripartite tricarboxylate transporter substrate binding protein n=1 Tax=Aeromonas caviae TaxID=648 RepID=UPI0004D7EB10|nr:tripartite tricarboxylate transporter substrate-binding protein [Aeromonas caviae]KEP91864.1 transporter [Aeromonas caviae]
MLQGTLKRTLIGSLLALSVGAHAQINEVHFLIPGGAGGGWDTTARGTGEVLAKSGLVKTVSYQNMSAGGGAKAIAHLIETSAQSDKTLMVNSTPIIVKSLSKELPQSFRDLTPVAAIIADYQALAVKADSPYQNWAQLLAAYEENPAKVKIAGGSARGSLDHLVAALTFKNAGADASKLRYVAYDAGGSAMAAVLAGETQAISTGFGEAMEAVKSDQMRILGVTSDKRLPGAEQIPTFSEQNNPTVFANWRGYFASPTISPEKSAEFAALLKQMYDKPEWEVVRSRNSWTNLYKSGPEFTAFLDGQEQQIGGLMRELGFIK